MWVRKRHRFYRWIGTPLLNIFVSRLNYKCEIVPLEKKKPYLVLCNHQTAWDMVTLMKAFKVPIYIVGSDDLFSEWYSPLMNRFFAPIPKSKSYHDISSVMNMKRATKEGGVVAIFPEGNRTFSGKTEYIDKAIVKLVRLLKVPLVLYNFLGGYGVMPRWGQDIRKGKYIGKLNKIVSYEEYSKLNDEELYQLIYDALYVDDTTLGELYLGDTKAEYVDRLLYVCPDCKLTTFDSKNDTFTCKCCGKEIKYKDDLTLEGIDNFKHIKEWYDYQQDYINNLDVLNMADDKLLYEDSDIILFENERCKKKVPIYNGFIKLYHNRFIIGDVTYMFDDISSCTVMGRNKLAFYIGNKFYQVKPNNVHYNAVKYVNIYYRYINQKLDNNSKYLGM